MPIKEFTLSKILSELEFTQREFIDLCILLGCDYCESIKGIGPKRAIDLMRQHRSIENILQNLDTKVRSQLFDYIFTFTILYHIRLCFDFSILFVNVGKTEK